MPRSLFADSAVAVNSIVAIVRKDLRALVVAVERGELDPTVAEERAVEMSMDWGRQALSAALSEQCRQATLADLDARGLEPADVTLRNEPGYWWKVATTLGAVLVFSFAYRFSSAGGCRVTVTPARDSVFPLHRRVRSSVTCLEWSCKVASLHPYRTAQSTLGFFSHNQVLLEDTTIARHATAVGNQIERRWLYKRPEDIADLLRTRATRHTVTDRPLLYFSSDAHLLRRYEGETWCSAWKNVNGVRLWCQDKDTGRIIHLGGEFTWGDCEEVVRLVVHLGALGILPPDGVFADGTVAQIVAVTDGAKWLDARLRSLLPGSIWLLDMWHAVESIGEYTADLYGKGSKPAWSLYRDLVKLLTGKRPTRRNPRPRLRKGPPQRKRSRALVDPAVAYEAGFGPAALIEFLKGYLVDAGKEEVHAKFIKRLEGNQWRMDYPAYRAHGLQVGSGAMESIHRNGSQLRLKVSGARWRTDTAQAVMNLRMLEIGGRWSEFWRHDGLGEVLATAFTPASETAQEAA
jgi:hypothetical protein